MSLELTDAQQIELESAGDAPLRVIVRKTKREYVVLSADIYERLRSLAEELTMAQVGDLVERTMQEYDEGDPTLASYQKYRP